MCSFLSKTKTLFCLMGQNVPRLWRHHTYLHAPRLATNGCLSTWLCRVFVTWGIGVLFFFHHQSLWGCDKTTVFLFKSSKNYTISRDEQWYFLKFFIKKSTKLRIRDYFLNVNNHFVTLNCDDFLPQAHRFKEAISHSSGPAHMQSIYEQLQQSFFEENYLLNKHMYFYLNGWGISRDVSKWNENFVLPFSLVKKTARSISRIVSGGRSISLSHSTMKFFLDEVSSSVTFKREYEMIVEETNDLGEKDVFFMAFDNDLERRFYGFFPVKNKQVKVPVPLGCMSCHYDSKSRRFTTQPSLFLEHLNSFANFHTIGK